MLNSLTVFLVFTAFLAFGYLSLLRMMSKQQLKHPKLKDYLLGINSTDSLRNLGSSAFFVSLPATALLLFWGWGPALIWLVIFHFGVESLFQLQYSTQLSNNSIADHLLRSNTKTMATVEQGLIQAFFLLSMAVVTALVATLLDRQPGLLFAILCLLPARSLISHPSKALALPIKVIGGILLLALGLAFSDQLGFSVYGDWSPLGKAVPWLVFNMPTLIAGVLVVAVFQLEKNLGFKQDLSAFAGSIIVLLVTAMVVKLAWLQPSMDAPMNSAQLQSDELPAFIGVSLFIFAGFAAFLIRLLNEEENQGKHGARQFGRLQIGSLLHTLYMSILVISLAAAMGIGAWKTHFIEWSSTLNILDYLNLAITSNLDLIYEQADSGTLLHTALLAALCFTGFSFLLMCANQLTVEEAEKESMFSLIIEAKILQAFGIFILSAYFIGNGISINIWLLIGMLAWVLFTHLVLGLSLAERGRAGSGKSLYAGLSLIILILGSVQIVWVAIIWLGSGHYILLALALSILLLAGFLWKRDLAILSKALTQGSTKSVL